jgi:CheY-like chemotaxis protein
MVPSETDNTEHAPRPAGKKSGLRHDLGNELAVVCGFTWLALTSLRQLSEKLEGDAQTELQSIVSMVQRIKDSAEQGRNLLAASAAAPAVSEAAVAPAPAKYRILAIDDSLPLLALLRKILTRAGYAVETFEDPGAALRRFGEMPDAFAAIVTDEAMPTMTGAALAEAIRAIRPAMPIILCTGAPSQRRGSRTAWAQAVIRKPYRSRELSLLVQDIIAEAEKASSHTSVASVAALAACEDGANAQ